MGKEICISARIANVYKAEAVVFKFDLVVYYTTNSD